MRNRKEIKVGTIVEVLYNYGPKENDDTIGIFSTVSDIQVHKGKIYIYLNKFMKGQMYKGEALEQSMSFCLDELEVVDFSSFFEMKRMERKIKHEVETT